jgi:hypothetical protein
MDDQHANGVLNSVHYFLVLLKKYRVFIRLIRSTDVQSVGLTPHSLTGLLRIAAERPASLV